MKIELGDGAWIDLVEAFVPDHAGAMARLVASLPLAQENIKLFGREVAMPRLTSWHGDRAAPTLSPARRSRRPLGRRSLRRFATGYPGLSIRCSRTTTATAAIPWARTPTTSLSSGRPGTTSGIASVSLGASRRFVLRCKRTCATRSFELGQGSLLVMGGTTQTYFTHAVPKTAKPVGPRLNLTFRVVR